MKRDRCGGTITVFLSLLSVLFLSLACTLVESARIQAARARACVAADLSLFSVFGEYERGLLTRYDVFFLDGAYGSGVFSEENLEGRMEDYLEGNLHADVFTGLFSMQLLPLELVSVRSDGYALMTDENGAVFYRQVVKNRKENLGTEAVSRFLDAKKEAEHQERAGEDYEESLNGNTAQIGQIKESAKETEGVSAVTEGVPAITENPLDVVEQLKKRGILGLVVKDEASVSAKSVKKSELPSGRRRRKGSLKTEKTEGGITAEAIFQDYLAEQFPNRTDGGTKDVLDYQLEYILAGKATDRENLKAVVNRLLLLREGVNFACALADGTMRRQAELLAVSLAAAAGIGVLAPALTTALLLAWSYGESLLDVRTLLAGGKTETVKTAAEWKLSLQNLGRLPELLTSCDGGGGTGLGYEEYLRMLLVAGPQKKYPLRALDLIEANLRLSGETENFRADACVAAWSVRAEFEIPEMFLRVTRAFTGGRGQENTVSVDGTFGYD